MNPAMTKKRTSPDIAPRQLLLPLQNGGTNSIRAGRLCRKNAVREALTHALSACDLSREDVAAELTRVTGEAISVNHLHNWCSDAKKEWRFPLELATAFCQITGDFGLIAAVLDGTGMGLADAAILQAAFGGGPAAPGAVPGQIGAVARVPAFLRARRRHVVGRARGGQRRLLVADGRVRAGDDDQGGGAQGQESQGHEPRLSRSVARSHLF